MSASNPPFDLVPLSSIPEKYWRGLPVFHPNEQVGATPKWLADEYSGLPIGSPCFDVGVVVRWEIDADFPELEIIRVYFIGTNGSILHYSASNLWVPKELLSYRYHEEEH